MDRDRFAPRRHRRGMSLLEVMVTIAIILTLMGVLAYGVMGVFIQSGDQVTHLSMGKVAERVEIHMLRHKKAPTTAEGLAAVYLQEDPPTDSWGHAIQYVSPGPDGAPFDLISFGRDGEEGTVDDLHWSNKE